MKFLILLFSAFTFFTACHQSRKNEKNDNSIPFDISTLPNEWIRLTKTDSGFVVFNSCDSGNLLLTIDSKSNTLLQHGQQEDEAFMILESATRNDTVLINTKSKVSENNQLFKFIWTDKKKGLGSWTTTYPNDHKSNDIFVERNNQKNFRIVDQPCKECWGDECDEIEK